MGYTRSEIEGVGGKGHGAVIGFLIFFLFAGTLFLYAVSSDQKRIDNTKQTPVWKYEVCMGNWVGSTCQPCMSYKKEDNTYILYDTNGEIIREMTISDGYWAEVKRK